jgi:hypothetical protein
VSKERRHRELNAHITVTWLPERVRLVPGRRIFVVGVCSDADPRVAARYGVRL